MSAGQHNSSHAYNGARVGRGARLHGKLTKGGFRPIGIKRLERLLKKKREN